MKYIYDQSDLNKRKLEANLCNLRSEQPRSKGLFPTNGIKKTVWPQQQTDGSAGS